MAKIMGGDFKKNGYAKVNVGFTGKFKNLQLQIGVFDIPTISPSSIASVRPVDGVDKKASVIEVTFKDGRRLLMSGTAKEFSPLIGYAFDERILGDSQGGREQPRAPDYLEVPLADLAETKKPERTIVYEDAEAAASISKKAEKPKSIGKAIAATILAFILAPITVAIASAINPDIHTASAVVIGLLGLAFAYLRPDMPIFRHRAAAVVFSICGLVLAISSTGPATQAPQKQAATNPATAEQAVTQPHAAVPDTSQAAISSLSPALPVFACGDRGIATKEIMGVVGEVQFREKPDKSAKRVVNVKATNVIGETQYQQIDGTTTVRELCKQGDWSEVQIVEPDWLTSHRGWVPSKYLKLIVKDASGKRVYSEENFVWDDKIAKHKKTIIAGVNKVARENAQCVKIDPGSAYLSGSKGTAKNPVFYVTCEDSAGRAFNVFFSASDVKEDKTLAAIQPLERGQAIQRCESAAKDAAVHPSTVDFSRFLDVAIQEWAGGRVRVLSKFTAKNSLGVELTFDIACLFAGERMLEALVSESRD